MLSKKVLQDLKIKLLNENYRKNKMAKFEVISEYSPSGRPANLVEILSKV